jgi:hypothetical protein
MPASRRNVFLANEKHLPSFSLSNVHFGVILDVYTNTMTPEYKAEKIASVSHLDGGGIWEINHVTLVAPVRAT